MGRPRGIEPRRQRTTGHGRPSYPIGRVVAGIGDTRTPVYPRATVGFERHLCVPVRGLRQPLGSWLPSSAGSRHQVAILGAVADAVAGCGVRPRCGQPAVASEGSLGFEPSIARVKSPPRRQDWLGAQHGRRSGVTGWPERAVGACEPTAVPRGLPGIRTRNNGIKSPTHLPDWLARSPWCLDGVFPRVGADDT